MEKKSISKRYICTVYGIYNTGRKALFNDDRQVKTRTLYKQENGPFIVFCGGKAAIFEPNADPFGMLTDSIVCGWINGYMNV